MIKSGTGIAIDIPGFGRREICALLTDFTGTLSRGGKLAPGVKDRLVRLSAVIDIHVLTADTFGSAEKELAGIALTLHRLEGEGGGHDVQKRNLGRQFALRSCLVLGNGNNDRLLLASAREEGGVAIAVDNGEGCATDALLNAHLFVTGAANALDLLIEPKALKATLRS